MIPPDDSAPYFAWQPRIEKKDTLGVLLRAGIEKRPPGSNGEFISAVLEACEVVASPMYLVAHPMFTSYFSGGQMEECWLANMLSDGEIGFSGRRISQRPVNVVPSCFGDETTYAPVTVIADFRRRVDAVRCRKILDANLRFERYCNRLDLRAINADGYQLRVEVAESTWPEACRLTERASAVAEICRSCGGRTEATWEE